MNELTIGLMGLKAYENLIEFSIIKPNPYRYDDVIRLEKDLEKEDVKKVIEFLVDWIEGEMDV